jgi:hypothetical protein
MKNLILAFALLTAPLAPIIFTGCKAPQQVVVYKSLAATQATVDAARKSFLAAYQAGHVDQNAAQNAMNASLHFNNTYNQAVLIARTTSAPTPEHVAQAAAQFLAIVATYVTR